MERLVAATDGSALGNPGPAGWCWYVDSTCWAAGGDRHATNNLMEIMAVTELLRSTKEAGLAHVPLEIQADSKYVIDALTKWVHGWKRNGWLTAAKKPVANKEIFEETFESLQGRDVSFVWIKGHAGHVLNDHADRRARLAATHAQKGKVVRLGPDH
jgi:ribonuclease HI